MAPADDDDDEKGPLAFLDRLLDDERDSNLHFGDVRFWQHIEHIDQQQIYRTKSLEYRTMKMMFCECIFYVIFLATLTAYISQLRTGALYESRRQQLDYWGSCTRTATGRACKINDVNDISSLNIWLRDELTPKAFTFRDKYPSVVNATSVFRMQDGIMDWKPRYVGDTSTSVLVGVVRIRQLRVQYNKGCKILEDFQQVQTDCFPAYSDAYQSKISWAPEWTPGYLLHHFAWIPANITRQMPMLGYHGSYPGDGFMLDLPMNISGAQSRLDELKGWQWIDKRTRAVIIEMSTVNPNVNIIVHNRILFEFPATGGVIVRQEAFALRALQTSLALMMSDNFGGVFLLSVLSSALHLMLGGYVVWSIYKNGGRFFAYFWSIVDLVILLLYFIFIIGNLIVFTMTAYEPNLQPEVVSDPEMFYPVGMIVTNLEFQNGILAAMGLMSWMKILKYFTLVSYFQPFVRVTERCIVNLFMFAGLIIIILYGFAVALFIGYGTETNIFSTLKGSFIAVIVAPAGGVSLDPIFDKNDFLGPVLTFAYIIVVFLLLLNVFMAICVDTYTVSVYEINECRRGQTSTPTSIFLWTYFNALKGVKLVGKETEEEIGESDEQMIALSSLPEAVQLKYLEMKRRMEAILNGAELEMEASRRDKLISQGLLKEDLAIRADTTLSSGGGGGNLAIRDSNTSDSPLPPSMPPPSDMVAPPGGSQELHAGPEVGNLGLSFSSIPPKRLIVRGVAPLTWGAYNGVQPGDEVAELNREPPSRMSSDEFKQTIKVRPIILLIRRPDPSAIQVGRVQLQRMLEDDYILSEVCGAERAVDVVRRFRVDQSGVDPYEAVAQLQASVAQKLDELEARGMDLTFDEMETLKTVSQELHSALTESQKEWRAELLTVMQMASLLSTSLIQLTRQIEKVQLNHNHLAMRAGAPK